MRSYANDQGIYASAVVCRGGTASRSAAIGCTATARGGSTRTSVCWSRENEVYGHTGSGDEGIYVSGATASQNVVYDNYRGVETVTLQFHAGGEPGVPQQRGGDPGLRDGHGAGELRLLELGGHPGAGLRGHHREQSGLRQHEPRDLDLRQHDRVWRSSTTRCTRRSGTPCA